MKKNLGIGVLLVGVLLTAVSLCLWAQSEVAIEARLASGESLVLTRVDARTETLLLGPSPEVLTMADPAVDIEGLESLERLKSLVIVVLPQLTDFGFLADAEGLEHLTISRSRPDGLGFLSHLPKLRTLRIETCMGPDGGSILSKDTIDLSHNPDLESLSLVDCGLEALPKLVEVPASLEQVDLSWNDLSITGEDTDTLASYGDLETLVLYGVEIDDSVESPGPNISDTVPQ